MIRTEIVTDIDRPVEEVFAFAADFSNLPRYDRWVESVMKTSDGEVGLGSTWTHRRVQGRRRFDASIRLAEFAPSERFSMVSGAKGFDVRSTMTFLPLDGGRTRVTEVLEIRLNGPVRLFEPLIRRQVPAQATEVHERLKGVLEARS